MTAPALDPKEPFALLDDALSSDDRRSRLLFRDPADEILCLQESALAAALDRLDEWEARGLRACGYVAYEAGRTLSGAPALFDAGRAARGPLLHFYAFARVETLRAEEVRALLDALACGEPRAAVHDPVPGISEPDYFARIARIKAYIEAGDAYQVNFAFKLRFRVEGGPFALYRALRDAQKVEFGALLNFPEHAILSLSPELFVERSGRGIVSRPMKGTAARRPDPDDDARAAAALREDAKTRAENLMIVDLIRNDLSKISEPGSVMTNDLFEVQTFETLHQLVSTVSARVGPTLAASAVLRGLFPCGSITGAPKLRAMQIIEELEDEPRGVYTGAIGMIDGGGLRFNVAIRTCAIAPDGSGELGIGGGILHESDARSEYEECLLKARFLREANRGFRLIETMRVEADGRIASLDRHLMRLRASAETFAFSFDESRARREIARSASPAGGLRRLRLLLDLDGVLTIETQELEEAQARPLLLDVSDARPDASSIFLRHKTTERRLYEEEFARCRRDGFDEILFLSSEGVATEASRHNLFIEKNGGFATSPAACGLLPGVRRALLLDSLGERCAQRPLRAADLLDAERIWLTNAARGLVAAKLAPQARRRLEWAAGTADSLAGKRPCF